MLFLKKEYVRPTSSQTTVTFAKDKPEEKEAILENEFQLH